MDYPNEIQQAEQFANALDATAGESFRDDMIDHGARIERLGKLLISKAASKDHPAIDAAIAELKEMVTTLIETADVIGPLLESLKVNITAIKGEWQTLEETKRRAAQGDRNGN